MAAFPRIDSPCPLRFDRMPGPNGFDCGHCQRHVHNLSALSETRREAFLASCEDTVCVAYSVPQAHPRAALAWVLAATVGVSAGSALAQSAPPTTLDEALRTISGAPAEIPAKGTAGFETITVGGVRHPRSAQRIDFGNEPRLPELPVIEESETEVPATIASEATPAARPGND